jgi:hypothetical protein
MSEAHTDKSGGKGWAKVKSVATHPAALIASVIGAPLLNYGLQSRRSRLDAELRKKEREVQAERIEGLLKKHKNLRASIQLGSGGNAGINRKIKNLRKMYKWMKRLNVNTLHKGGKVIHKQSVAKEIGQLQKRFNLHREQRMALESGDIEKVTELVNPMVNKQIELSQAKVAEKLVRRAVNTAKEESAKQVARGKKEVQDKIRDWEKAQNRKIITWGGIPPALGIGTTAVATGYTVKKTNESEKRVMNELKKAKKKKKKDVEFGILRTASSELKLLNKVRDRYHALLGDKTSSPKRRILKGQARKDNDAKIKMLENWQWQVNKRLSKLSQQKSVTPSDGNNIPKRKVRTKEDHTRTRREHKLNKMTGHEPRSMSMKKRKEFMANRDKLLKQLGWE